VQEESTKEGPLGTRCVGLAPGTESGRSSSGVKGNADIKKGYTFSKSMNCCRYRNCYTHWEPEKDRGIIFQLQCCSLANHA